MGRSGFHEAPESTAPDHWAGPLTDWAVDDLIETIETALDDDTTGEGIVNSLLFRNFREHHVIRDDLRAAIGRAAAEIASYRSWEGSVSIAMARRLMRSSATDADLELLAKIAEGGGE